MILHRPFSPSERGLLIVGLLRVADAAMVVACALFAFWLRSDLAGIPGNYILAVLIAIVVLANALQLTGLYEFDSVTRLPGQLGRVMLVWAAVAVTLIVVAYFTKTSDTFSRLWFATWFITVGAGLIVNRLIVVWKVENWRDAGKLTRRVAFVGAPARAEEIVTRMASGNRERDIDIVGIYAAHESGAGAPGLAGGPRALEEIVRTGVIDEVIIATERDLDAGILVDLARMLGTLPVEVRFAPDVVELPFPVLGVSYIGATPLFDVHNKPLSVWSRVAKRVEDLVLGSLFIVLSAPLMAIIAVAIRLSSPGPALFRQSRLGFNNNMFTLYKFRTMRDDVSRADSGAKASPVQARRGDPRVTAVGRFLRRTSLDELPQLFNVIRGEMSLVGPRPHAVAHNSEYAHIVDGYIGRHRVKPGLTGWAQVCGFRGETDTLDKMRARVEHDLYYISNWSIWFDLKIIVLTLAFGFVHRNAY